MDELLRIAGVLAGVFLVLIPLASWAVRRLEKSHDERWKSVEEKIDKLFDFIDRDREKTHQLDVRVTRIEARHEARSDA
jgi:F0F1-type ATP synthase membrane subunit b/b'